jgi:hypothetical protein
MDEAVEEVEVLQRELKVLKVRLGHREAADAELKTAKRDQREAEEREQEAKRQRGKLEQVHAVAVAELGAAHEDLEAVVAHLASVAEVVALQAVSPLTDSRSRSLYPGSGRGAAAAVALRAAEAVRQLYEQSHHLSKANKALKDHKAEAEGQVAKLREAGAASEAVLVEEREAHRKTREYLNSRQTALRAREEDAAAASEQSLVVATENTVLKRSLEILQGENESLKQELDRRARDGDESATRAHAAMCETRARDQRLVELDRQMATLKEQLRLAEAECSTQMLRAREEKAKAALMSKETEEHGHNAEEAATESSAKTERIRELRTALTTAMHQGSEYKVRAAESCRAKEEAQQLMEREASRADELQQELGKLQQLSEQQVKVANDAYHHLEQTHRQKTADLEGELGKLRAEKNKVICLNVP